MKRIYSLLLCAVVTAALHAQTIELSEFAVGFTQPLEVVHAGDARLFVVEQTGLIKVVNPDGAVNATAFLDMSGEIGTGGERGLLGLVFHPQYSSNGFFFISYTRASDNNLVIARYSVDPSNPNIALANSGETILTVPHTDMYHFGGTLRFGPDGYLYIACGDGETPVMNAQTLTNNLGKMLRIDVNQGLPYTIPADNPFVGLPGNDEIWAYGLRNPWKFSFDLVTSELWIADVGQATQEEINRVPSNWGGLNYGWPCFEGNGGYLACTDPVNPYSWPISVYSHGNNACSITGGYVYRGSQYPNMQGKYLFADFCSNKIKSLDQVTYQVTESAAFPGDAYYFSAFGEDVNKELYVVSLFYGKVYKLVDTSLSREKFTIGQMTITPNPASETISLGLRPEQYPVQLTITDLSGKRLLSQPVGLESERIAVSYLQSGVYILTVTDNAGKKSAAKLLVE